MDEESLREIEEHVRRYGELGEHDTYDLVAAVRRLREHGAALRAAVEDVDAKLTREDDGEWVRAYVMPAGPWHRLLGLARGAAS